MTFNAEAGLSLASRPRRNGLRRWGLFMLRRLQRMPGTPYSIAAGFASGVAVSFTPYLTLHTPLALGLAWLLRGNLVASFVGTWVGNLATTPLFWLASFQCGRWILEFFLPEFGGDIDTAIDSMLSFDLDKILSWNFLAAFFLPMAVGSNITAPLGYIATFYPCKWLVETYRRRRADLRERRRAEVAQLYR